MSDLSSYVIALYIRLSIEDSKVESLSIDNQKIVLHRFADLMEGVGNTEVLEYVDNGYSGTNFERPAVQTLLESVQEGKINCIIVKDFTRFGRNSIEVGYFMEMVFPLYGVRFISINDDFDSDRYHGDTGGLNVAFKYLIAEFYSRDLSVKSTTAKLVKMKRGEYQSKICLYGYQKGANGRMEPNPETSPIVRMIFELAAQGYSTVQISKVLLEQGIPTPGEYKAARGIARHDVSRSAGLWQVPTITKLLADERYTGTYIIGKRHVTEVGSSHFRMKDESEWIKIPNHHPAIVSKELFEQVQSKRRHFRCPKKNVHQYLLRAKVFCGCCQHALARSSGVTRYYYCRHSQADESAPCYNLTINERELETIIYDTLSKHAQIVLNIDNISNVGLMDLHLTEQVDCGRKVDDLKARKRALYEQFVFEEIGKAEYMERKAEINKELDRLEEIYSVLKTKTTQIQMDEEKRNISRKLAQDIVGTDRLTAELVDALIDRINVYPGNRLDINWKINDFCLEV